MFLMMTGAEIKGGNPSHDAGRAVQEARASERDEE